MSGICAPWSDGTDAGSSGRPATAICGSAATIASGVAAAVVAAIGTATAVETSTTTAGARASATTAAMTSAMLGEGGRGETNEAEGYDS